MLCRLEKDTTMKKIGIMTWYQYQNYGSVLQAAALYQKIKELGYAPDLIHYTPRGLVESPEKINFQYILCKSVSKLKNRENLPYSPSEKTEKFNEFKGHYITETEPKETYPELYTLNQEYDAFVCGSDQVWSPLSYDDKYFLSFVENPKKKVAYAPSLGCEKIANDTIREKTKSCLLSFDHLSVREKQGQKLIRELTGKMAQVVADPTLLMDQTAWNQLIPDCTMDHLQEDKYILCYFLGNSEKYFSYVKNLSEMTGIPYHLIPMTEKEASMPEAVPFVVGPAEFVSLIRNAAYVCTDSFHGMAFSVTNHIPFTAFKRFTDKDPRNQNSRIFNLLDKLHLQDRLADPNQKPKAEIINCNFAEADAILQNLRNESLHYLQAALNDAVSVDLEKKSPYKITDLCCGCGACTAVCPTKALCIKQNEDGFLHYEIDASRCIQCGQCRMVCPMVNVRALDLHEARGLWAVKSNSDAVLSVSSSGGIGYELGKMALSQGLAVAGCTYNTAENCAEHIIVMENNAADLSLLQGSKYIQSRTDGVLSQMKELICDKQMMFFGTPCQTAAADKLLRKWGKREDAVLVELICHGVPSKLLFDNYLQYVDSKYSTGPHPEVDFRYKALGWRNRKIRISGQNHTYICSEKKDDFYAFFRRSLADMESCFDCPYRQKSCADIRIGDYWGPRYSKDQTGVSMVLGCTEKGEKVLSQLDSCMVEKQNLDEYWTVQYPYNYPAPVERDVLLADLHNKNMTIPQLRKQFCEYYDRKETISRMKEIIKRIIK